jgi:hypothetical protein
LQNLVTADLDRDGRPDLVVAVAGGIKLAANESSGGQLAFRPIPAAPTDVLAPGGLPATPACGDVTGDGIPDLVIAYRGANKIAVLPGTATAFAFAAPAETAVADAPIGLVLADVDGDGRLEVAVSRASAATVSVFEVAADGMLFDPIDVPVGTSPSYLRTADFDRDGRADLIVTNSGADTVTLLLATPPAGFRRVEIAAGRLPTALLVADLDEDGFTDILVASSRGASFRVVRGDGRGGVFGQIEFPGTYGASSAVLADLDADGQGRLDLVIGSVRTERLSVFRNTSPLAVVQ